MKKTAVILIAAIFLAVFVGIFFGNHTFETAPYWLSASPMIAYRITGNETDIRYFRDDPKTIHGYAIIQQQVISDSQLQQDVKDILNSRLIYGTDNDRCFEPGIAIHFGNGDNQVDALICLTCRHIYFFRGDQVTYRNMNSTGVARIKNIYPRLFPGHSADETDSDTDRIAAVRAQERDRREEASLRSATRSATESAP
jgi:hypothetical protein